MPKVKRDTDMVTITRAQFQEAVQRCANDFRDCCPDTVPKNVKNLFVFAVRGWTDGLEVVLFDDTDEGESDESI